MEQLYEHMGTFSSIEDMRRTEADDIRFSEMDFLHRKLESLQSLAETKLKAWKKHEDEAMHFISEVGDDEEHINSRTAVEQGLEVIRKRVLDASRFLQVLPVVCNT